MASWIQRNRFRCLLRRAYRVWRTVTMTLPAARTVPLLTDSAHTASPSTALTVQPQSKQLVSVAPHGLTRSTNAKSMVAVPNSKSGARVVQRQQSTPQAVAAAPTSATASIVSRHQAPMIRTGSRTGDAGRSGVAATESLLRAPALAPRPRAHSAIDTQRQTSLDFETEIRRTASLERFLEDDNDPFADDTLLLEQQQQQYQLEAGAVSQVGRSQQHSDPATHDVKRAWASPEVQSPVTPADDRRSGDVEFDQPQRSLQVLTAAQPLTHHQSLDLTADVEADSTAVNGLMEPYLHAVDAELERATQIRNALMQQNRMITEQFLATPTADAVVDDLDLYDFDHDASHQTVSSSPQSAQDTGTAQPPAVLSSVAPSHRVTSPAPALITASGNNQAQSRLSSALPDQERRHSFQSESSGEHVQQRSLTNVPAWNQGPADDVSHSTHASSTGSSKVSRPSVQVHRRGGSFEALTVPPPAPRSVRSSSVSVPPMAEQQ